MYQYQNVKRLGKKCLKGNMHCHTTTSDGRIAPEVQAQRYREAGYDFLCLTDHEQYTARRDLSQDGFLIIPAVEWSCSTVYNKPGDDDYVHHINAIEGTQAMIDAAPEGLFEAGFVLPQFPFEGAKSAQDMRQYVNDRGCIAIYNHPKWSRVTLKEMGDLEGYTGVEIFNRGCELEDFSGYAEDHWDQLLNKGRRIFGLATDDNHNSYLPDDSFGGWVMVDADELSQAAIVSAIIAGDFYATSGPEIIEYGVKDGMVYVDCSGVNHVQFVCGGAIGAGSTKWDLDGGNAITHAEHKIAGHESFIRIRCERADGRVAWSQPIWPEG